MRSFVRFCLVSLVICVTACTTPSVDSTPSPVELVPYQTQTQSPIRPPEGLITPKAPLPSPTPFTYTVKAGDTFSSIALQFGVSIDDLQAANPQISVNAMSIGTTLKIPSDPGNPSGEPTPTAALFVVQQIECYPTTNKGMWCFVLVHNEFPEFMENLSAQISLIDSKGGTIASQTAWLPLNILPPDTSLPLTVYFPPDIPFDAQPLIQILTGIRLSASDPRYLPATVHDTLVQIRADGHYAEISGEVRLPNGSGTASQVWVAAVAYDENGRIVGVKRWEGGGIQPGGSLLFEMAVSSLGGKMKRVEFAVEARP